MGAHVDLDTPHHDLHVRDDTMVAGCFMCAQYIERGNEAWQQHRQRMQGGEFYELRALLTWALAHVEETQGVKAPEYLRACRLVGRLP